MGFKNLLRAIECYGISSVYGIRYLGLGNLPAETFVMYVRQDYLAKDLLQGSLNYVPKLKALFDKITTQPMSNYESLKKWYVLIFLIVKLFKKCIHIYCIPRNVMMLKNEKRETAVHDAIKYFEDMTSFQEEMGTLQKTLRIMIQ